jgi:hypothetical protein
MLDHIHMTDLKPLFAANNISGLLLHSCEDLTDVRELCEMKNIHAKAILSKIVSLKACGNLGSELSQYIVINRSVGATAPIIRALPNSSAPAGATSLEEVN